MSARRRAPNTRRAYQFDWQDFEGWCAVRQPPSLPAKRNTVGLYLTSRADGGRNVSAIQCHRTKLELPEPVLVT